MSEARDYALAAVLFALVVAHSWVPWRIRRRPTVDPLGSYDRATIMLGTIAAAGLLLNEVAFPGAADGVRESLASHWPPALIAVWGGASSAAQAATLLLAGVAGVALPATAVFVSGRPRRRRRGVAGRGSNGGRLRMAWCAVAEEMLWRGAAPLSLSMAGLPLVLAVAVVLVAFVAVHVPSARWRSIPYVAVAGTTFTGVAALGGLPAACVAHVTHNVAVAALRGGGGRPRPPASRDVGQAPALSRARRWDASP